MANIIYKETVQTRSGSHTTVYKIKPFTRATESCTFKNSNELFSMAGDMMSGGARFRTKFTTANPIGHFKEMPKDFVDAESEPEAHSVLVHDHVQKASVWRIVRDPVQGFPGPEAGVVLWQAEPGQDTTDDNLLGQAGETLFRWLKTNYPW